MAVGIGVNEIVDSEEEPLTSSPTAVSDAAVDKPSATARQDAQAMACSHQDSTEHIANVFSSRTDCLDADPEQPSMDFEKTSVDHSNLQPVHQAETNDDSTCTTSTEVKAGLSSPQTSRDTIGLDQRCRYDNEYEHDASVESRNTAPLHETQTITAPDEHMSTPLTARNRVSDACTDQQMHPQDPPVDDTSSDRLDSPVDTTRSNATCSDSTLSNSAIAIAHAFSGGHEIVQHGSTSVPSQERTEFASGEALAENTGPDIAYQTSVDPHSPTAANLSNPSIDTSNTTSRAASISEATGRDAPLSVADLTPSRTDPYQGEQQIGSSAENNALSAKETMEHEQSVIPAIFASVGSEPAVNVEEHLLSGMNAPLLHSDAQSHTADELNIHNESKTRNIVGENAVEEPGINEKSFTQVPADLPPKQSAEETHSIAEQAPKHPPPNVATNFAASHPLNTQIRGGQHLMSTAAENQLLSPSTTSEVSKPSSPHSSPVLSPQEITLAELRAQKAALLDTLKALPAIQVLIEESQASHVDMSDDDGEPTEADITAAANKIVKEHIRLLHDYNELKDVGQGLMGIIADQRGLRIVEVQDEFGIDAND
ncbi:hypothetical protein OPT61_g3964 [Boeremia exigua]|uniref:Uncharacterized protein n=1 Tax=Boeremia exigua TaxID=749465 RepID=A0ACC2IFU9_9PLEO|nr:hypothetical protein OPT61_g3964 [Boeremia exigua]